MLARYINASNYNKTIKYKILTSMTFNVINDLTCDKHFKWVNISQQMNLTITLIHIFSINTTN